MFTQQLDYQCKKGFWSKEKLAILFHMSNLESAEADCDRHSKILPASYKKTDLHSCILRQEDLFCLLEKFEEQFEGYLGLMPGEPYSLKLKPTADPVHTRTFLCLKKAQANEGWIEPLARPWSSKTR